MMMKVSLLTFEYGILKSGVKKGLGKLVCRLQNAVCSRKPSYLSGLSIVNAISYPSVHSLLHKEKLGHPSSKYMSYPLIYSSLK